MCQTNTKTESSKPEVVNNVELIERAIRRTRTFIDRPPVTVPTQPFVGRSIA